MMPFNPKTQSSKSPAGPEAAIQVKQPAEIQARLGESVHHSIIPDGMQISGDLVSTGDINVKGKIEGNITCRTLTLEGEPIIGGSVRAETIRICGSYNGDVLAPIIHDGHRIWARRGVLAGLTAVFRDGFLERLEVDVRGSSGGTCRLV